MNERVNGYNQSALINISARERIIWCWTFHQKHNERHRSTPALHNYSHLQSKTTNCLPVAALQSVKCGSWRFCERNLFFLFLKKKFVPKKLADGCTKCFLANLQQSIAYRVKVFQASAVRSFLIWIISLPWLGPRQLTRFSLCCCKEGSRFRDFIDINM